MSQFRIPKFLFFIIILSGLGQPTHAFWNFDFCVTDGHGYQFKIDGKVENFYPTEAMCETALKQLKSAVSKIKKGKALTMHMCNRYVRTLSVLFAIGESGAVGNKAGKMRKYEFIKVCLANSRSYNVTSYKKHVTLEKNLTEDDCFKKLNGKEVIQNVDNCNNLDKEDVSELLIEEPLISPAAT